MFIDTNLRYMRTRSGLSQQSLADDLKVTRSALASYEGGTAPSLSVLISIADYFRLSVDTLIRVNLEKLSELQIRELEAGHDIFIRGGKLRVLATTVNEKQEENIEMVDYKARAGYLTGYHDPEYIGNLPRFNLPMLPNNRTYRAFQTQGDSMLPIESGTWIIAEYVSDWGKIKNGTPAIIITREDGIVFKIIRNEAEEKRKFILESLNPDYKPYEISVAEIIEVWKFKAALHEKLPESPLLVNMQDSLRRIESMLTKNKHWVG